eukprot:gene25108-31523_t
MPLTAYDNPILKKYVLGVTKAADGGPLYKELFSAPTKESIAIAEKLTAARAAGVGAANAGVIATDEPRVEELPDDAPVEDKKKTEEKTEKKATAAAELD